MLPIAETTVFYSDFTGLRLVRTTHHCVVFTRHFDQYLNSIFARTVSFELIVWC